MELLSNDRDRGRIGALLQLRPDQVPGPLADIPSHQRTGRRVFAAARFHRAHVAAPGQALVQILFIDARKGCESLPVGGGDLLHDAHLSESLDAHQAIRYRRASVRSSSGTLENGGESTASAILETNQQRRLRKLKDLCDEHGGLRAVAAKANLNPVALEQIVKGVLLPRKKGDGARSPRALGDPAARALEEAWGKERGWFDNDEHEAMLSPTELRLLGYFRDLDADAQEQLLAMLHEAREDRNDLKQRLMRKVSVAIQETGRRDGSVAGRGTSAFGALHDEAAPYKKPRNRS